MKTDRVEGANQTRTHAKQRASQREIDLSVDSGNVANYHGDTGEHRLPCRFLSVDKITARDHSQPNDYLISGIIGMPSDRDI